MSSSICRFMPQKKYDIGIKAINFVLETELHKLRQPFFKPIHVFHLVTRGEGFLIIEDEKYPIKRGSLFPIFPGEMFELKCTADFEYAYISFQGKEIDIILADLEVDRNVRVYNGYEHLIGTWLDALRRIDSKNADILPVSILLYTMSYITDGKDTNYTFTPADVAENILQYVSKHYDDPEISLRHVAGVFNYTQKYLSGMFKKKNGIGFCEYVNNLRIKKALTLIQGGLYDISMISEKCGFSDPLYFSKVFKTKKDISPTEYIKLYKS